MMEGNISVKAESKIWYVDDDGPADFHTIQEAVNNATSGDIIYVYNGAYYENIVVDKSVSLVGEDRESTIVDGNRTGTVISITAHNVNIRGFTIKGSGALQSNSGIFTRAFSGNEICHSTITNNNNGIHFEASSGNEISDNIISSNKNHGIHFEASSGNEISDNIISSNNNHGIHFEASSGNEISDNIISSNNNHGIFLGMSGDMVSGNTITNNNDGIYLYWSWGSVISSNIISSNNDHGICLYWSWGSVISSNIISSNNDHGIFLGMSGDNTIYHNNFNNTHQVETESTNLWNRDNEGNYWSDYNGADKNQDGIGDTPYIIDENNRDNYPLMGMFSDLRFTFSGQEYHVNVISNSTISDLRFEIGQETANKIVRFCAAGEGGTVGFCRVAIPIELMNYSYIVLDGVKESVPTKLNVSSETFAYLYFTYIQNSHAISIISSKTMQLYYEMLTKYRTLLDKYIKSETDLYDLNATYQELLNNYTVFLGNYNVFLTDFSELQKNHQQLNNSYQELNNSYQELLLDYSKKVNNIQNLMYIFAATTAIFIITAIYLSRSAHANKAKVFEESRKKRTP